jgi:hypothetical protein
MRSFEEVVWLAVCMTMADMKRIRKKTGHFFMVDSLAL